MRGADWGASLKEARGQNPGATLAAISKAASDLHHAKRAAQQPRQRITGKSTKEMAAPGAPTCTRWSYPGENRPPPKRRLPVRSQPIKRRIPVRSAAP